MEKDFQFQQDERFDWRFLRNKTERHAAILPDTQAATGANYGVFFIALAPGVVEDVWETHKTAGSSADAALNIEKLASGVALDSGTTLLSADLELDATANVPRRGTLKTAISAIQFARGDRLALKDVGTLTNVAHVCVMVQVRYKL